MSVACQVRRTGSAGAPERDPSAENLPLAFRPGLLARCTGMSVSDRAARPGIDGLNVPRALRPDVEQIVALTDQFCAEHLDAEYARLCARLVAKLSRKRPSPLLRGDLRIWAAATIYAVGSVNFLFDRAQPLHLSGDQLSELTGVPKRTMANKAKQIRDLLGLDYRDLEFCRRDMIETHPSAWYVQVDGLIVDARMLPAALQQECRRLGLIPELATGA